MIEIFYMLLIFIVFMGVFGRLGLHPMQQGNLDPSGISTGFALLFGGTGILAVIAGAYMATNLGIGTSKSPLWAVYGFMIALQVVYLTFWVMFWTPLIALSVEGNWAWTLGLFSALLHLLVESIFIIGCIQMSTGGWGLYK